MNLMSKIWIYIGMLALDVLLACNKPEPLPPDPALNGPEPTGNSEPTPYNMVYPPGFPVLKIPKDNPLTVEGVALGKKLFYDKLLSADNTIACASCHKQEHAFVDDKKFSLGVNGQVGARNAMPLFNLGWAETFNPTSHRFMWDGGNPDLENQVLAPIQNPVEMNQNLKDLEQELRAHPEYPLLFKKAFGTDSITIKYVMYAIAQFERTLILSRTEEGRKAAMARGVSFGRPKKMRPDQAELARQLVLEGKSISAVARTFNVHPATIYRCIEPNSAL